jgi:hypothetical protein
MCATSRDRTVVTLALKLRMAGGVLRRLLRTRGRAARLRTPSPRGDDAVLRRARQPRDLGESLSATLGSPVPQPAGSARDREGPRPERFLLRSRPAGREDAARRDGRPARDPSVDSACHPGWSSRLRCAALDRGGPCPSFRTSGARAPRSISTSVSTNRGAQPSGRCRCGELLPGRLTRRLEGRVPSLFSRRR